MYALISFFSYWQRIEIWERIKDLRSYNFLYETECCLFALSKGIQLSDVFYNEISNNISFFICLLCFLANMQATETVEEISDNLGSMSRFGEIKVLMQDSDFQDLEMAHYNNPLSRFANRFFDTLDSFLLNWEHTLKWILYIVVIAGYYIYFGYAMSVEQLRNESSLRLLWQTCFLTALGVGYLIYRLCSSPNLRESRISKMSMRLMTVDSFHKDVSPIYSYVWVSFFLVLINDTILWQE